MSSFAPTSSAASAAATTTASSTTTTTSAPTAAAPNSSNSPDSPKAVGSTQQSSSSDGSSPMRRLPTVLRPPPTSAAATSTTRSQSQTQQPQQAPTTTTRDLTAMSGRHLYPSQSLAGGYNGGSSPPLQMQSQFFSDGGRGRLTTYDQTRLSPVSSPAMAGDSWEQSRSAAAAAASMGPRGLKRHLQQSFTHDIYGRTPAGSAGANMSMRMPPQQPPLQKTAVPTGSTGTVSTLGSRRATSSANGTSVAASTTSNGHRQAQIQQIFGQPPNEDPLQYEPSGEARHPRDSTRYETWTSKQLRKKCSHLKLRGLKNVKKHVMVEALYRYYRNQRLKDIADGSATENNVVSQPSSASPQQQRRMEPRRTSISGSSTGGRPDLQYRSRYDQRGSGPPAQSQYGSHSSRSRGYGNYGSQSPSPPSSGGDSGGPSKSNNGGYYLDEESKGDSQYKEVPVTSEDVIRLVDVVLSPEFVDRLAAELSRWQFWVDVREMYIALLNRQHPPGASAGNNEGGPVSTGGSATNSRNFKWSSMQLWEIWKELSFAYTKTCFEFTAAGVDDREYINFCDGRPDVYYLHQRLHARPDLLHLIKSNEYIDEKCTSEASESIAHEQQQAQQQQQPGPLVGSGSPMLRSHKRYKRSGPMVGSGPATSAYSNARVIAAYRASDGTAGVDGAAPSGGNSGDNTSGRGSGDSRGHSPEENSTENSETTGEEGSSNTANSNASNSSVDESMRAALAEQKYFGLLLQNFEVIFESLHNKKVLLATLRKDNKAPDHMVADLHDDIHVLSALKKEFRNKLRHTMQ